MSVLSEQYHCKFGMLLTQMLKKFNFYSLSLSCHYFIILILSPTFLPLSLKLLISVNSDLCPWPILPSVELRLSLVDLAKSLASAFVELHLLLSAESPSWFGCLCLILGIGFGLRSGIVVM